MPPPNNNFLSNRKTSAMISEDWLFTEYTEYYQGQDLPTNLSCDIFHGMQGWFISWYLWLGRLHLHLCFGCHPYFCRNRDWWIPVIRFAGGLLLCILYPEGISCLKLDTDSFLLQGMVASNTGGVHATGVWQIERPVRPGVSSVDSVLCFPLGRPIVGSCSYPDIAPPFVLSSVSAQVNSVGFNFREAGWRCWRAFSSTGTAASRSSKLLG